MTLLAVAVAQAARIDRRRRRDMGGNQRALETDAQSRIGDNSVSEASKCQIVSTREFLFMEPNSGDGSMRASFPVDFLLLGIAAGATLGVRFHDDVLTIGRCRVLEGRFNEYIVRLVDRNLVRRRLAQSMHKAKNSIVVESTKWMVLRQRCMTPLPSLPLPNPEERVQR